MDDVLEESRKFWDGHALRDPLWAILSDPSKKDGKWNIARFFQTGVSEIASLLYELDSRQIALHRGSALDFGCGAGRLTQALGPQFNRVVGVDISPEMVAVATRLNRFPQRVSYVSNHAANLKVFGDGTFNFIVSNIVLQHIPPAIARQYLQEFLRVLAPGGILVFQLPSHRRGPDDRPSPSAGRTMPDEAYQASLAVTGIPGRPLGPASEFTLDVAVTNGSAVEWSRQAFGVLRVGDHWLDRTGRMLLRDDGRSSLPETLRPGETGRVPLTIRTPPEAGEYLCEIDVAHEGVVWFEEKGSPTVRFTVRVGVQPPDGLWPATEAPQGFANQALQPVALPDESSIDLPAPGGANLLVDDPGAFPMYGIETDALRELIAAQGGTVLHAERDPSCGDEWVSYRYFVRTENK